MNLRFVMIGMKYLQTVYSKLNQEMNTTLIIVTHDPEIADLTNRIVQIRDGVVVEDGS